MSIQFAKAPEHETPAFVLIRYKNGDSDLMEILASGSQVIKAAGKSKESDVEYVIYSGYNLFGFRGSRLELLLTNRFGFR